MLSISIRFREHKANSQVFRWPAKELVIIGGKMASVIPFDYLVIVSKWYNVVSNVSTVSEKALPRKTLQGSWGT